MKKSVFCLALAVIAVLSACNKTQVIEEAASGEITLRPLLSGRTKASSTLDMTADNLQSFTVNARNGDHFLFENEVYTKTDIGESVAYVSEHKHYWPSSGSVDFFAYAYDEDGASQVSKTDYKTFVVTPDANATKQVDLVYAVAKEQDETSGAGGVPLTFQHTGSKIAVKVKNSSSTLKFEIEGWKVAYLSDSGTFTYSESNGGDTFQWNNLAAKEIGTEYRSTFATKHIDPRTDATPLEGSMILVPQTLDKATAYASADLGAKPTGAYIAVKMKVHSAGGLPIIHDGNDNALWAVWPVGNTWNPGCLYTYTIELSGGGYYETNQDGNADLDPILEDTEIQFVFVEVANWDENAENL